MKALLKLEAAYTQAAAALAHLEALPAALEAERDKLISNSDFAAEPSAELTSVATKLLVLPTKTEQARKILAEMDAALAAENAAVAAKLSKIANDREHDLRSRAVAAIKPLFSSIDSIESSGFLQDIIARCDGFKDVQTLRFAGSGSYGVLPITKARELLALKAEAGL